MTARFLPVALAGAGLIVACTGMMAGADGITKLIAGHYAAPQLFALSAALVVCLSILAARVGAAGAPGASRDVGLRGVGLRGLGPRGLGLRCRRAMAVRAGLTVVASVAFFQAFRSLPFADVFLFIGLIPVIAAALSGPMLGEPPRPMAWAALLLGSGGMLLMMPGGVAGLQIGHLWAGLAALTGCGSLLAARYIAKVERVPLAQVFWPNLALMLTMAAALPFVWQPMGLADLGWIVVYAALLFGARYASAEAMRLLPAHVALPLMNLQFVWMVAIGFLAFAEVPQPGTMLGAALVIASGLWLVAEEHGLKARLA